MSAGANFMRDPMKVLWPIVKRIIFLINKVKNVI